MKTLPDVLAALDRQANRLSEETITDIRRGFLHQAASNEDAYMLRIAKQTLSRLVEEHQCDFPMYGGCGYNDVPVGSVWATKSGARYELVGVCSIMPQGWPVIVVSGMAKGSRKLQVWDMNQFGARFKRVAE